MEKTKKCPKCKGEMIIGNYTGQEVDWEKKGEHAFLKKSGLRINSYACEKCGYMESYVKKH